MYQFLHDQPFDDVMLRKEARETVRKMRIITGSAKGDREMYRALLVPWWTYVEGFEKVIDNRMVTMLPIRDLIGVFGIDKTRSFLRFAVLALSEMHLEEGSHAVMWKIDAERNHFDLQSGSTPLIVELLEDVQRTPSPVEFFCQLAATEYIAESFTEVMYPSNKFLAAFQEDGDWPWGNCHLVVHEEDKASHLAIDIDIARALCKAIHGFELPAADVSITVLIRHKFAKFLAAAEEAADMKERWKDVN